MLLLASVVFALHTLSRAWNDSASAIANVTDAFTKAKIVPDVIPTFNPNAGLSPIFTGPSGPIQVLPGMSLSVNDSQAAPQYLLASNDTDLSMSNTSWVVTIVDPDASPPQFLHFLGKDFVVDPNLVVQGGGLTNATGLMNTSQAVVEFVAPNPPSGPAHRYVVLVYKQPSDFNTTAPAFFNSTNGTNIRQGFKVSEFATNTSLGDPIAGSFFLVGAAEADTTSMTSSSTASMSSLPSVSTSALSPSSPSSSPSSAPAATITNAPSGAEKVTSWMSLLITTTLTVGLALV